MANILRDELIENNYVSTNNIDNELPPTHVVLYLKNISGIDKKTVIEPIPLQQVLLTNQNPSLKLIDNKAVFCLSPPSLPECIPTVSEVSCLCLDTTKNYKVTVDGQSITGTFEEVVTFLDSHGLYAYPSETECNPAPPISCDGATSDLHLNVKLYRSESGGGFHVYNAVNNELIARTFGYYLNENSDLSTQLEINPNYADKIEFLDLLPTVYDGDFTADAFIRIRDISSENIRIRVDVKDYGANVYEKTTLDILISYPNTPAIEWNENDATNAKYSLNACLAPSDICVPLPPLDLNLSKTFYPFDTSKQYHLYYQDSEGNVEYREIYGKQLNNTLGYITARDLRLNGFEFSAESEVGFYPDYCNEWGYTGDFYVTQNKATWMDSDYIGFFYIEMDGNRQYLDNSSKNFPHAGDGANLKLALAPYYESVAAFLREVGIDAVYKPNMWGSYNSGGITINMTEEQHSTISFGSQSGYDLKFDGYAHANCINSKTLSELPNPPSTLHIIALDGGKARKSSYTLLGSHPPIDLNSINILTLFGITGNYEISSCFINISE